MKGRVQAPEPEDICYSDTLLLGWAYDHHPDDDGTCMDCGKATKGAPDA